jgi:hypothetical protein
MLVRALLAATLLSTTLLAIPQTASAHQRMECRRYWHHGHQVRRCRPVPHRHYHRPPPHHRPPPPPPHHRY